MKSRVCKIANTIKGVSRSEAFRTAWAMVKGQATTRVNGVTHGDRQTALEHLTRYERAAVNVQLVRERENLYDTNAIAVFVSVNSSGVYKLGYLPAEMAAVLAPVMDKGNAITARVSAIVGGFSGFSYGARLNIAA